MASCKNLREGKQCTLMYCHKCLLNRYGENAEEVERLDDWTCPKCKGMCNCSICMKKRGHQPTGMLVQTAKATGFSSVSEMLQVKGPENVQGASPKKQAPLTKDSVASSPLKPGKENSFHGDCNTELNSQNLTPNADERKSKKVKREGLKELSNHGKVYSSPVRETRSTKKASNDSSKKEMEGNAKHTDCFLRKKNPEVLSRGNKTEVAKGKKNKKGGVSKVVKSSEEIVKKEEAATCNEVSEETVKAKQKVEVNVLGKKNLKQQVLEKTNMKQGVSNGVGNDNAGAKANSKVERYGVGNYPVDVQLPQGTSLVTIGGIDLSPMDVGHALQFLEFCAAFGEVLQIKTGQAVSVVREIVRGRSRRQLPFSSIGQIHIQLMSLIQEDMGKPFPSLNAGAKDSWLKALGECLSESQCASDELLSDINKGVDGYNMLNTSKKLKLLNFLCDEALSTATLRKWIEDQNSKSEDKEKEIKQKVLLAKNKEKDLKKKMQDKLTEAIIAKNGAALSISEHDAILTKIKREVAQAHREMQEATGLLPKKRQIADAVRTEPILSDANGHTFWKLKCYTNEPDILLQDMGITEAVPTDDKWFIYKAEQIQDVEKYISSLRTKRLRCSENLGQTFTC